MMCELYDCEFYVCEFYDLAICMVTMNCELRMLFVMFLCDRYSSSMDLMYIEGKSLIKIVLTVSAFFACIISFTFFQLLFRNLYSVYLMLIKS